MPDALEEQLTDLARALHVPVPDGLEAAVMARVAGTRPRRRWRRWLAGLLLGALGAGVVVSPVGAEIRGWFGLPGVSVTTGEAPVTGVPEVPPAEDDTDLARAAELAGFVPRVPSLLGDPEHVEVSQDARVVSLSWTTADGTVRLDEVRGDVDPIFWKTTSEAERVTVGMHEALWLPTAHEVAVVTDGATGTTLPSRLSAPTLLWVDDDVTLRLEGHLELGDAREIGESIG